MNPIEAILFIVFGLGSWVILVIALVIIPLRSYLLTRKLWVLSSDRRFLILLKGRKAQQSLFYKLTLMVSLLDLIISMMIFNRFALEGAITIIISVVIGFLITFGEERVPRKNLFWFR